ncbi:MAG TPA: CarD family transcriptional regulator [Myxococcales bacterium]|jgi:RNA polymerase-interacting CarD/CdnL/TRCF family regulator|nr:CarD family transcriptional regulator [Myxococcales bacterium]
MSDSAPQLTLAIGDRVVYPNQGVCRVFAVDAMEVAGQRLTMVSMRREEDGAVVRVPEAKVKTIGLRKVASSEDVEKLFAFLKSDSDKADLDWKQRARTNADRMSAGGIMGLAEVVKGLQVLSELRPLPTKERELYDNARHLLVSELAASLGIADCDAEDSVDVVLFPPGRERPKRTAAEFARGAEGEDGEMGDLGDDLMGLGGDLDLPDDETVAGAAAAEDDEATVVDAKSSGQMDDEVTQPTGTAYVPEGELPPKRKRGRPPKPKPPVDPNAPPPEPKRRGRPPKPKPEGLVETEVPKRRGRPPKKKPEPTSP